MANPETWISKQAAADRLGCSAKTIDRLRAAGELRTMKRGKTARVRVRIEAARLRPTSSAELAVQGLDRAGRVDHPEFRRGRGITVVGTPERGAVFERVRELVGFARKHGYDIDELIEIIHAAT